MKLEKRYVCPKCNWAITDELHDLMRYSCPICKNDFAVRWEKSDDTFILLHKPNEFWDEPLGLPRGSVRALIMLLLSISTWFLIIEGRPVPEYLLNLLLIVVGYYFAIRTTFLGVSSLDSGKLGPRIEIEQEPLYLPRGYIRVFIALGFAACALYLAADRSFQDMGYKEFFFILLGLMLGFVIQKATVDHREKSWYLKLGHLKAFIVLSMTTALFLLIISDSLGEVDVWVIRLIIAFIGFYFTSR